MRLAPSPSSGRRVHRKHNEKVIEAVSALLWFPDSSTLLYVQRANTVARQNPLQNDLLPLVTAECIPEQSQFAQPSLPPPSFTNTIGDRDVVNRLENRDAMDQKRGGMYLPLQHVSKRMNDVYRASSEPHLTSSLEHDSITFPELP